MKTFILILLLLTTTILTVNCSNKKEQKWKYEIHGYIQTSDGDLREAIWYTDTITLNDNGSIYYDNSDGSRVTIESPFILIDHSLDSTYINR
jgi:hypothetical protein